MRNLRSVDTLYNCHQAAHRNMQQELVSTEQYTSSTYWDILFSHPVLVPSGVKSFAGLVLTDKSDTQGHRAH